MDALTCVPRALLRGTFVAVIVFATAAHAKLIYRWVDEHGRVHVADQVPDRYRANAQRIDTATLAPPVAPPRVGTPVPRAAPPPHDAATQPGAPPASAARVKRPAQVPDESTDCETWWRLYHESEQCFGPFRTRTGIKAEAFEHCNEVLRPEAKCGPLVR